MSWITGTYAWLKINDLPNWLIFGFTAIVWPGVLFLWGRRTVNGIRNFQVTFAPTTTAIQIGGVRYSAIAAEFLNGTQSVVYITHAYVRRVTGSFPMPAAAARNIATDARELKFLDNHGQYIFREVILHTNQMARTCIPVTVIPSQDFYDHRPSMWRRLLRLPKYFEVEYTAMVGKKRYRVCTLY